MIRQYFHTRTRSLAETAAILVLAVFLTVCAAGEEALAAGLPAFDSVLSVSDAKQLTRKYDADGYFLISKAVAKDKGLFGTLQNFYFTPEARNIDAMDTFVHESFHVYTRSVSNPTLEGKVGETMTVYVGNKKGIKVTFTPIFRTKKIVKTIPARCRTSTRFDTYVKDTGESMLSDWDGVYGLLNEFGGYCWGMHDNNRLFAYRDRFADTKDTWTTYVEDGESDRLAYAEFKYYILHYLYYAKTHKPAVYQKIIANEPFKEAYQKLDSRFTGEVAAYEKKLPQLQKMLKHAGIDELDMEAIEKSDVRKGYNTLIKEMKKSRYQQIQKVLAE